MSDYVVAIRESIAPAARAVDGICQARQPLIATMGPIVVARSRVPEPLRGIVIDAGFAAMPTARIGLILRMVPPEKLRVAALGAARKRRKGKRTCLEKRAPDWMPWGLPA